VLVSRSGLRYAYIISWRTKSSNGTTVGRELGVYWFQIVRPFLS
jgi:hypothetical protein